MKISMYSIAVNVFSILPENYYDKIINFLTAVKYRNYLKRIKKEMLSGENADAKKYASEIDTNHFFDMFQREWVLKYRKIDIPVKHIKNLMGKKYSCVSYISNQGNGQAYDMYLPGEWKDTRVRNYIRGILIEQDDNSFHQYFSADEYNRLPSGTVIDIGTAEGNFALDMLNKSKQLYLFECDKAFVDALNLTFDESIAKGTTKVVTKYVGNVSEGNKITLDDYFADNMPKDISVIKMDIEGAEQDAINGMKKLLAMNPQAILLICAYHSQDAEKEIRNLLHDYDITTKKQYVLIPSIGEQKYPYIRHGILKAKKY